MPHFTTAEDRAAEKNIELKLSLLHSCLVPGAVKSVTLPEELKEKYGSIFNIFSQKVQDLINLNNNQLNQDYINLLGELRDILLH